MEDETRSGSHGNVISESIRRHVIFVLVVAIATTCAAIGYTATRHNRYTSTAKVVISPIIGNALSPEDLSSGQQTTVAMTTEAALVASTDVYSLAIEKMQPVQIPPPTAVKALVPPNTKIVQIQVTDASANRAANGAKGYAEGFLAYRASRAQDVIDDELARLSDQSDVARSQLQKASDIFNSPNPPADAGIQVQRWTSQLASITNNIGALKATNTDPGIIVSTPVPPNSPDGLNAILIVLAAVLLGLGIGALLAIWRERRDDRIRTAYDDEVADIPVLATLPGKRRMTPARIVRLSADDELRVCYRRARAAVIAGAPAPAVLVISSVDLGAAVIDPAGEVAANLGWSLTAAGFSVTVVDATIGTGQLAELLGLRAAPGLSDQLMHRTAAEAPTQSSLGMRVLPAGSNPEAAREFYAGARLAMALSWFTAKSDYVIVAGPPISTPDGEAVALAGDALVGVVVDKETTHQQVASVADRMRRLGVRLIGAVGLQRRLKEGTWPTSPQPEPPRSGPAAASRAPHASAPEPADSTRGTDGR